MWKNVITVLGKKHMLSIGVRIRIKIKGSNPFRPTISMNFKCKGKLEYYTRWLILLVNDDIAKYYQRIIHLSNRRVVLQHPKHGAHITVIAGKYEDVGNHPLWKKYQHQEVEFEYSIDIGTDECYFWLPVECRKIEEIRVELGLSPKIPIPWHLTVGNLK